MNMQKKREMADNLAESFGENLSQYESECAHYGDAGVGQAVELRRLLKKLRYWEKKARLTPSRFRCSFPF